MFGSNASSCAHYLTYWEASKEHSLIAWLTYAQHSYHVYHGEQKRVQCTIDGEQKDLYLSVADTQKYGIDLNDFEETFLQTKAWMERFSLDTLNNLDPNSLRSIFYTLRMQQKEDLATLQVGEIASISLQPPPSLPTSKWSWQPLCKEEKPSPYQALLLHRTDTAYRVSTIATSLLSQGGCAAIHTAERGFVVRIDRHGANAAAKRAQAALTLTEIHKQHKWNATGIEPIHTPVISLKTRKHSMTITTQALGSYKSISKTTRLSDADRHLIASHVVRGLASCIQARVAHLDIKPDNILIYGETDANGNITKITDAKLCDFDGAIHMPTYNQFVQEKQALNQRADQLDLNAYEQAYQQLPQEQTYACTASACYKDELQALLNDCELNELVGRGRALKEEEFYPMTVFAMGLFLYELYTEEKPLATRIQVKHKLRNSIIKIDHDDVQKKLRNTALSPTQQHCITCMLRANPKERPSAEELIHEFCMNLS